MLSSLIIKNYALISHLEVDFSKGFSVITGETGAGKSIIIGALSLILGQRADSKSIKEGENKCIIEGIFDISSYHLQDFFNANELEYDPYQCILRREIYSSGKSRAFINDSPVGLNEIKLLGSYLIDIHSQHQNLMLTDNHFQIQVLDALAGNKSLKTNYQTTYNQYTVIQKKLQSLKEELARKASEEDYLQFQYNQLSEANLKTGELEELEIEAETLSHVEEIKNGIFKAEQLLSEDEYNIVSLLKETLNTVTHLNKVYPESKELSERIESAYLDIKDLASEISIQQEQLELNPERLKFVTDRLDLLYSLQQKHRLNSIEQLIDFKQQIESQLNSIHDADDQIDKLETEQQYLFGKVIELAGQLTDTRKLAAGKLEEQLVKKVSVLGMPNMQFSCLISSKKQPDINGIDEIDFLFSANKNVTLKPVSEIASGGEISRLMLGTKALIAGAIALPAIIFDEIDTGVSGEIADKMGDIMKGLGTQMQVITITHLPQIAAKGTFHYFVYKEEAGNTTETNIRQLDSRERIKEIAQMLSGSELTQAALEHAKNLLQINNNA